LNRLAGTLINDVPQYDFNGAANVWAFNVTGKRYSRGIDAFDRFTLSAMAERITTTIPLVPSMLWLEPLVWVRPKRREGLYRDAVLDIINETNLALTGYTNRQDQATFSYCPDDINRPYLYCSRWLSAYPWYR
jgi:hypothetical protein